ncbi:MAG TPA: hypothetical protein O0X19_00630 [Methanocorpusculum sp.]|nr:hypothetical protein [Candidatus Methanocorpusculum equi]MCQ2357574.1 hypothetical protein [Methanocorpusculum sp.]HJJ32875.1 hypothetical protein [Methanocorpusculum sp.]HJJ44649.1 hypothetical protein [Methanocorpusculum sp.]HJJ58724.1 hypothetical protein [Methanocorpusculum sp.]
MGTICPLINDRCLGNECKFWRADAKHDVKADTVYELSTGECLFIRTANHLLSR